MYRGSNQMNYRSRCPHCGERHEGQNNYCKILCRICRGRHPLEEMVDGICPLIFPQVKQILKSKSFPCEHCEGEGSYDIQIVQTVMQSKQSFDKKLASFQKQGKEGQEPKKKVLRTKTVCQTRKCEKCEGAGFLHEYKFCCFKGCNECDRNGLVVNKKWFNLKREIKMKGFCLEQKQKCLICHDFMNPFVVVLELECQHHYHRNCILKWFKKNRTCPICRKEDQFIDPDGELDVIQNQEEGNYNDGRRQNNIFRSENNNIFRSENNPFRQENNPFRQENNPFRQENPFNEDNNENNFRRMNNPFRQDSSSYRPFAGNIPSREYNGNYNFRRSENPFQSQNNVQNNIFTSNNNPFSHQRNAINNVPNIFNNNRQSVPPQTFHIRSSSNSRSRSRSRQRSRSIESE